MKKLFLILGLSLIFLGTAHVASATSGACSDHGGVNCSAGIGSLGANAICNDGYESSTSYYDTGECVGNLSSCSQPIKGYCTSASDYRTHCGVPDQYTSEMYDVCHADCENQINEYQSDLASYNTCLLQQPESQTQYIPVSTQSVQQINHQINQESCTRSYAPNAVYSDNGGCNCQSGYKLYRGLCVPLSQYCSTMDGTESLATASGMCECARGYQFNGTTCTPVVTPDSAPVNTPTASPELSTHFSLDDFAPKPTPSIHKDRLPKDPISSETKSQNNQTASSTIVTTRNETQAPSFWSNVRGFFSHLNPLSWF